MKFLQLIKKGATAPTPEEGVLYYNENIEKTVCKPMPKDPEGFVDLGLPSGTLWASCNLGATKPEEYGKYFQWGDTVGYYSGEGAEEHSYSKTAPYYSNVTKDYTKYDFQSRTLILEEIDDAATQYYKNSAFHIPTSDEIRELKTNTISTWYSKGNTEFNGVAGRKFTSKTDSSKYIFLPAAGSYSDGGRQSEGLNGYYWGSNKRFNTSIEVYGFYTDYWNVIQIYEPYRERSQSIRAVMSKA